MGFWRIGYVFTEGQTLSNPGTPGRKLKKDMNTMLCLCYVVDSKTCKKPSWSIGNGRSERTKIPLEQLWAGRKISHTPAQEDITKDTFKKKTSITQFI
jgi:hypothetical protein